METHNFAHILEEFLENLVQTTDLESDLSDLESSSSFDSDYESAPIPPSPVITQPTYNQEEIAERHEYVRKLGQEFINNLPQRPNQDDFQSTILYLYFYSVQFVILFNKLNGVKPIPQLFDDTDEEIKEKAYFMHLNDCFIEITTIMDTIASTIYKNIKERVSDNLGGIAEYNEHPISFLMEQILMFRELHSRRAKLNPAVTRMKIDTIQNTMNCITCEKYDANNEDHKLWKMLIFNPLHSDYDNDVVDLSEQPYQIPPFEVPKPFFMVVTSDWDKLIRILHICVHFQEYFFSYINECIKAREWETIENMSWAETWKFLTKDYGNLEKTREPTSDATLVENVVVTTVNEFSREKKQVPLLVFRISVLRDFLKVVIKF